MNWHWDDACYEMYRILEIALLGGIFLLYFKMASGIQSTGTC